MSDVIDGGSCGVTFVRAAKAMSGASGGAYCLSVRRRPLLGTVHSVVYWFNGDLLVIAHAGRLP